MINKRINHRRRRGTLSLEAALVLPPAMLLIAFLVLAIRFDLQQLVLAEAVDQAAAELSLLLPLQEAGRDLLPDWPGELSGFVQNLGEKTGDWAQSTLLEITIDRRLEYWLHEPAFWSGLNAGLAAPLRMNPAAFSDRSIEVSESPQSGVFWVTCTWRRKVLGVPLESILRTAIPAWPLTESIGDLDLKQDNPDDVWLLDNFSRGRQLRKVFWANLPHDFPVIARWSGGEASGIHSLDVTAPTYQNPDAIHLAVMKHLQRLAEFDGAIYERENEQIAISGGEIVSRCLVLIIPENENKAMTGVVWQKLGVEARSLGVHFQLERYGTSTRYSVIDPSGGT
jgi:hypothetical protein